MNLYLLIESSPQCYTAATWTVAAETGDEARAMVEDWDPRTMSTAVLVEGGGVGVGAGVLFFTDVRNASDGTAARSLLAEPNGADMGVYLAMETSPKCQVARLWVVAASTDDEARSSIGTQWRPDIMSLGYLCKLPLDQTTPTILFQTSN